MQNPAQQEIELTTAPSEDFGTHWGQQVGSKHILVWFQAICYNLVELIFANFILQSTRYSRIKWVESSFVPYVLCVYGFLD